MPDSRNDHLYTARVILPNARSAIERGAMRVRNGVIAAVGPRSDFGVRPDCAETDLGDVALVPGLVNAHAHLAFTPCRGMFKRGPFVDWIFRAARAARTFTREQVAEGIVDGVRELARNGTTAVGDIVFDHLPLLSLEASGLRYACFYEVINMTPPPYGGLLREIEERLAGFAPGPRAAVGLSPHTPYTVARPLMAALRRRFQGPGRRVPFSIHVAECRSEIHCLARQAGRLADNLRRIGFYPPRPATAPLARSVLDFLGAGEKSRGRFGRRGSADRRQPSRPRDILVHGNFLSDADVRALAEADRSTLVICPGTREFHGVHSSIFARVRRWGLPIALGTDSLASNTELNMWTEMRRALRMARGWTAADVFDAATIGGARALGLGGVVGELRPGYRADFVAVALGPALVGPGLIGSDMTRSASAGPTSRDVRAEQILAAWLSRDETPPVRNVWVEGEPILNRALYDRGIHRSCTKPR